jgi:hypothetical protein
LDVNLTENNQQLRGYEDRTLPSKLIPRAILALFGAALAPSIIVLVIGLVPLFLVLLNGGKIQSDGDWTPFIAIIVIIFIVSSIYVIVLGVPAFIVGWYFKKIHWWTSVIAAFVIGALPTAVFLWPLRYPQLRTTSSRWDGEKMVQTMIQGVPTVTGWTDWLSAFTIVGLFGVSGGLVFWLVWKPHNRSASSEQAL